MTKEEAGNSRAHYTNSLRFFRSFAQKSKPNMLPTLFSPCSKKRAQVTIFVIITVLLVAGIVAFFVFQDSLFGSDIPRNMRPVYDAYLDCVEDIGRDGVYLMGQQGGYIDTPEFSPGSAYRPFSSHLDFFGQGVPYWMYVSGNNIMKEQIPTKAMMTEQLETYIEERLDLCNFREYELQGYSVYIEEGREGSVDVRIEDSKVEVTSSNPMNIYFGNDSVRVNEHSVAIDVRLGALYDQAKELYNYERTDAFLEKYAIDVLRLLSLIHI